MAGQIQTQKKMLRELSNRLIKYTEDPSHPDALKPYYLFRMNNNTNEFKVYLIGYRLKITKDANGRESYFYEDLRKIKFITRSVTQIKNEELDSGHSSILKISVPLLGSKFLNEDRWQIEPSLDKSGITNVSISTIEGIIYSDTIWLQNYDPELALNLLMKNKIDSIYRTQRNLDILKLKYDIYKKLHYEYCTTIRNKINED